MLQLIDLLLDNGNKLELKMKEKNKASQFYCTEILAISSFDE